MRPCVFTALSIVVVMSAQAAAARTWHLRPDGSGEAPTIHAAIDSAAAGDVIELACGTYYVSENHDTQLWPRSGVTFRSESGDPSCAVIAGVEPSEHLSLLYIHERANIRFEGLTVTGGYGTNYFYGAHSGGFEIWSSTGIEIVNCVITGNTGKWGGGLFMRHSEVTMIDTAVTDNTALLSCGGLLISDDCIFHATSSRILNNAAPNVPDGFVATSATAVFTCCDIDLARWDVQGALTQVDEGCGDVAVANLTWGAVKSLYQ